MNSYLTQSLLAFFGLMLVASFMSCLLYALARWIESRIPKVVFVLNCVVNVALFLFVFSQSGSSGLVWLGQFYLAFFVIGWIGGWLHRKSGGNSPSQFAATLLLMGVMFGILVSVFLLSALLTTLQDVYPMQLVAGLPFVGNQLIHFSLMVSQALVPPFLIWMWKSSKLRPGVDVPFENEKNLK